MTQQDHEDRGHDAHEGQGGHGHHDHSHDLRGASKRSMILALVLISTYMAVEVVAGVLSGSLALIADAGHMATAAAAIGMALVAMWIAGRAASAERTFGYQRTEVLATLTNTVALWAIAGWILFKAYQRASGEGFHVEPLPVLLVGLGGFLINIVAAKVLHASSEHNMSIKGAFQHVVADVLSSLAVVVSAVLILAFDRPDSAGAFLGADWTLADPILSAVIALLIVYNSRHLIRSVMGVLLEGVPEHIDVYKLCSDIEDLEGVTLIHDVHVWTITSGSEAFSAHVLVDPSYPSDRLERLVLRIQDLVHREFGIQHATVQAEQSLEGCIEDHHVDHLMARARS